MKSNYAASAALLIAISFGTVGCASMESAGVDGTEQSQEETSAAEPATDPGDLISLSSLDADNIEGVCERALGPIEDVIKRLGVETMTETKGWVDEFFPTEPEGVIVRCQANVVATTVSGKGKPIYPDFSVATTAGDALSNIVTQYRVVSGDLEAGYQIRASDFDEAHMHEVGKEVAQEMMTKFLP